jgi:hypothetical protein
MYPLVHNAGYAPFEETFTLKPGQPVFVPTCSFNGITSFHYKITGGSNNQLNAFFVDSEKQYSQLLKGLQFSFYQQKDCHVTSANSYEGTCTNVSASSGLIINNSQDASSDQKVTVFVEELN